jgi:hypothetical protein
MPKIGDQAPWPYDISLAGTPLMLVRTPNRFGELMPAWKVLGQQQIQERLDTGDLEGVFGSPQAEVPWTLSDFSGGMGLREQKAGVTNRYSYASNVDARVPNKVMLGPLLTTHTLTGANGTVRAMATMNIGGTQTFFVGTGQYVYSTTDGSTFSQKDLGSGRAVTSMVVYRGDAATPFLFVGVEAGQNFWTYDGTTWTEHASLEGTHFTALEDELWRSFEHSDTAETWKVAKSTDGGATSTWTPSDASAYVVGDPAFEITEITKYDDRSYVFSERDVFTLTHAASSALAGEVWPADLEQSDVLTGVGSATFGGRFYMVLPQAGLYEYTLTGTDQFIVPMGPDLMAENDSPVRGKVTAVCGERDYYLWAAIQDESGNSYLMCWDREQNAWHGSIVDLGAVTVRKMVISDKITTNPQLWIGMDDDVGSIVLPRAGRDRSNDSNCTFASSGQLYMPRFTALFPFLNESFLATNALVNGLSTGDETLRLHYRIVDGGAFTALSGTWSSDPGQRLEFPTTGLKNEFLDTYLHFARGGTTTNTPKLEAWVLLYALRPPFKRAFEFTAHLGTHLKTNSGARSGVTLENQRTAINNTMDAAPVTLIGIDGTSYTVFAQPGKAAEEPLRYSKGAYYEAAYDLICFEHAATNLPGSWGNLENYTWGQLEGYTWGQLESL